MTIGRTLRWAITVLAISLCLCFLIAGVGYTLRGTPDPWSSAVEFALTMGYGGPMDPFAGVLRYAAIACMVACMLAAVVIELCIFAFVLLLLIRGWHSLARDRSDTG